MTDFETRFSEFIAYANKITDDYCKKNSPTVYEMHGPETITFSRGPKYIRVIRERSGDSRSAFLFVDKDGNIYKCDSWSKPAKHIRGNIFDENFSFGKGWTIYGGAYMR